MIFKVRLLGPLTQYLSSQQCSALRKNGHVVLKGRACKIVNMSTSKTGKHGHTKVHVVDLDIFTSKKYKDICPSTDNVQVSNVNQKEFEVMGLMEDGFFSLMNEDGDICNAKLIEHGNRQS